MFLFAMGWGHPNGIRACWGAHNNSIHACWAFTTAFAALITAFAPSGRSLPQAEAKSLLEMSCVCGQKISF